MATILGLASSVIAVVTVVGAIIDNIKVIRQISRSFKDAPKDVKKHLEYLEALKPVLLALEEDCHKDGAMPAAYGNLWNVTMDQLGKSLEEMRTDLAKLAKKLEGHRLSPGQVAARIREAFSEEDIRARCQDISEGLGRLQMILLRINMSRTQRIEITASSIFERVAYTELALQEATLRQRDENRLLSDDIKKSLKDCTNTLSPALSRTGTGTLAPLQWIDGFSVPFRIEKIRPEKEFVPRNEEMRRLEYILLPESGVVGRRIFVLHGLGGIGKSSLAIEFAKSHQASFDSIFLLNGSTLDTLIASFTRVVCQVTKTLPPKARDMVNGAAAPRDDVEIAKEWFSLKGNDRWLIIFDNADLDPSDNGGYDVPFYFPDVNYGSILVTTRLVPLANLGKSWRIEPMSGQQARQLLSINLRSPNDDGNKDPSEPDPAMTDPHVEDLLETLDGLPLAIIQAARYIAESRITFKSYLQTYATSKAKLMKNLHYNINDPKGSIRTTWNISFDQLQQGRRDKETQRLYMNASRLLQLWAFLDHRNVWFKLLKNGNQGPGIPQWFKEIVEFEPDFTQTMRVLLNFSLVDGNAGSSSYSMHSVVHDWCRACLVQDRTEDRNEFLALAIRAIGYSTPRWHDQGFYEFERRLLVHADVILPDLSTDKVPDIPSWDEYPSDETDSDSTSLSQQLLEHPVRRLVRLYHNQGKYESARAILQPTLDRLMSQFGVDSPVTLLFVFEGAVVDLDQERYDEAESHAIAALDGFTRHFGPNHELTLHTLNVLATIYHSTNRHDKDIEIMRDVVARAEGVLGRSHSLTLKCLSNLAVGIRDQGDLDEAEEYFQRSLERREQTYGPTHERTLEAAELLADTYDQNKKLELAEKLRLDALHKCQQTFGLEDWRTARAQSNLANVLSNQGKNAEAIDAYLRSLESIEKVRGPTDLLTVTMRFNLGLQYKQLSRLPDALSSFEIALDGYVKTRGAECQDARDAMEQAADVCIMQGHFEEAEVLLEKLRAAYRHKKMTVAESTLDLMAAIARGYLDQGNFGKAGPLFETTLSEFERALGPEHESTLRLLGNYAMYLIQCDRPNKAEPVLRRLLSGPVQFGPISTELLEEAEEMYERAISRREMLYPTSGDIYDNLTSLGVVYLTRKKLDKAEEALKRAIAGYHGSPRPNWRTECVAKHSLGLVYEEQNRLIEAAEVIEEAAAVFEQQSGQQDRDTIIALQNLARVCASLGRLDQTESLLLRLTALNAHTGVPAAQILNEVSFQGICQLVNGSYADSTKWFRLADNIRKNMLGPNDDLQDEVKDILSRLEGPGAMTLTAGGGEYILENAMQLYLRLFGHSNLSQLNGDSKGLLNAALSHAARNGHSEIVKLLLEKDGIEPELMDEEYGQTPLSWAGEGGHEAVVELLLRRKDVDPDSKSKNGRTPLSWAALRGQEAVVKLLLEQEGVDPNSKDEDGMTPLALAAMNGHDMVVHLLLVHPNVNPEAADSIYNQTPLSWATENGHSATVKLLLSQSSVSPNSRDKCGQTPLTWAIRRRNKHTIHAILAHPATNPNIPDTITGWTALHQATASGQKDIITLLVANGGDLHICDVRGHTPLHVAAIYGQQEVVRLLLAQDKEAGIARDGNRWTPAMLARRNGFAALAEELEKAGKVDLVGTAEEMKTPMRWKKENEGIPLFLLEDGCVVELSSDSTAVTSFDSLESGYSIRTDYCIPFDTTSYYFEIEILHDAGTGQIAIGLSTHFLPEISIPGWTSNSWAYHGDDGEKHWNDESEAYAKGYTQGDVVGVGVELGKDGAMVWFTKNGKQLGMAFANVKGQLYPTVGLVHPGSRIRAKFGLAPPQSPPLPRASEQEKKE